MSAIPLGGESFVTAAVDHGRFTLSGDSKACNRAYNKIVRAAHRLKESAGGEKAVLVDLLAYPDDSVKSWAAAYLLPICPEAAAKTLEDIASGSGLIAFSAAMTLKEWHAGRLKLP